ncbi:hypothetical protein [Flavobacterium cellulosilyticum]|uniref:Uncharacterized protein n=1 Tax=Flavobacterium cellulosilyticum TaxID=2541731 RepID=A0A4R5CAZ4_9FLAO|nr:hypothetical protein [Flavobacterium cellulosilyticum]TDD94274.1 hypothetical protein E0F76_16865 [Flavobacterium cellulosilyticum]
MQNAVRSLPTSYPQLYAVPALFFILILCFGCPRKLPIGMGTKSGDFAQHSFAQQSASFKNVFFLLNTSDSWASETVLMAFTPSTSVSKEYCIVLIFPSGSGH